MQSVQPQSAALPVVSAPTPAATAQANWFEAATMDWHYKDPTGNIQGPFSSNEMGEWFEVSKIALKICLKSVFRLATSKKNYLFDARLTKSS